MSKKIRYILGLTVACLLPLSLYFVTRHFFSSGKIQFPGYHRVDKVDSTERAGAWIYDTVFHRLNDLVGWNQLGEQVSLNQDLKGKVLVLDFIFTTCRSTCPRLSASMQMLQKSYEKKLPEWVQFISISVDPDRDSVPVLREYANRYTKEHDEWWFLTGNRDAIFNYAKNELGLILSEADEPGAMVHSNKLVLIDSFRYIRGYYDGLDTLEMRKLADDIAILYLEKNPKNR